MCLFIEGCFDVCSYIGVSRPLQVNQARYMTTDPEDLDNGESTTLQQKQTTNNTSAGKKSKTFAPKPSDVSVSGFNPDDLLPKELKKHKGKTWKVVVITCNFETACLTPLGCL